MTDVIMPQVGQDIPTATILAWHKQVGDTVSRGDVIAEVESDKATFEVEADCDGVLSEILHEAGAEVEVFKPIGRIGAGTPHTQAVSPHAEHTGNAGDTTSSAPSATRPAAQSAPAATTTPVQPSFASASGHASERIFASPLARRLAREHGIELRTLVGSGPGGRIKKRDVMRAARNAPAASHAPDPGRGTAVPAAPSVPAVRGDGDIVEPFGRIRQRIAERLTASKRNIPHFYLFLDVDMTDAMAWRTAFNTAQARTANPVKVTITDLLIKATAHALTCEPTLNAHVEADKLIRKAAVNIGVATSTDDGLLVPVIADADRKSLTGIAIESKRNAAAARQGQLNLDPVGSFTISSMGMFGIRGFVPIINPPQCAILAVGAIEKRLAPVEVGGVDAIAVRHMMTLTLAADHRAVDGVVGARFLNSIKDTLENLAAGAPSWG